MTLTPPQARNDRETGTTGSNDSPAGPTRIRPFRGLPTGRAVVGALLVATAALGLFVSYRQAVGEPDSHYVTVRRAVSAGQRLAPADLTTVAIDLPGSVAETVFADVDALDGAVAVGPLEPDQLVRRNDVLIPRPGTAPTATTWREISFTVAASRAVDGHIRAGEHIDLVATYATGGHAETAVVFSDVPVLRLGTSSGGFLGGDGLVLTVALDDPEATLATIHAVDRADELTVVRSTTAHDDLPPRFAYVPGDEPPDAATIEATDTAPASDDE